MVQKTENMTDYFQGLQWCGWSPLTRRHNKKVAWQRVHSVETPAEGGGWEVKGHMRSSARNGWGTCLVSRGLPSWGTSVSTDFCMMRWSGIQNLNSSLLCVESTSLFVVLCSRGGGPSRCGHCLVSEASQLLDRIWSQQRMVPSMDTLSDPEGSINNHDFPTVFTLSLRFGSNLWEKKKTGELPSVPQHLTWIPP